MKKLHATLVVAVIVSLLIGVGALAGGPARPSLPGSMPEEIFESTLIGSTPNMPIRGIASAGAAWVVAEGEIELLSDGTVDFEVEGLLLTSTGTVGPVTGVRVALTCEGTTGAVATTSVTPLDANGNAELKEQVTLPTSCLAPIFLIRIGQLNAGPINGPYIAASGF